MMHITNGDALTARLRDHFPDKHLITWNEILCEGPATTAVLSEEFISLRSRYLIDSYEASKEDYNRFVQQFDRIDSAETVALVLWFEYDLFCQINLAALVYFLNEAYGDVPLYLVCSGEINGSNKLFGLNELNDDQLLDHFDHRIHLTTAEITQLCEFWKYYTADDPTELANTSVENEVLKYLEQARMAHIHRYPDSDTGINQPEGMILKAISDNSFENDRQLIGYLLRNQGYYGFGDLQWEKKLLKMSPFFTINDTLRLNSEGEKLLRSELNVFHQLKDTTEFGGSSKYNYIYDRSSNNLLTA